MTGMDAPKRRQKACRQLACNDSGLASCKHCPDAFAPLILPAPGLKAAVLLLTSVSVCRLGKYGSRERNKALVFCRV